MMYITHDSRGYWVEATGSSGMATVSGPHDTETEAMAALAFHTAEWDASHPAEHPAESGPAPRGGHGGMNETLS